MNNITTDGTLEEAARWSARLCAPDCTDRERADFERWMRMDGSHADAFAAAQLLSDGVGLLAEIDPCLRSLADEAFAMGGGYERPRRSLRRWAVPMSLAAGVALAIVGFKLGSQNEPAFKGTTFTASSQARSLTLADGSKVQLDVGSQIRVALSPLERRVELVQGRALFDVAHDRNRPFSVTAAHSRTTALGTRFQVQRDDGAVAVTLTEGSVAITEEGAANGHSEKLVPGEQLSISGQREMAWVKKRVDAEVVTSWSHGRLVFRGTPLTEAIAELNRYSNIKLTLADPSLGNLLVSGNFIPGDSRQIANAFAYVLPVRIVESGREVLFFRRYESVGG